jgi:hypothetical protein
MMAKPIPVEKWNEVERVYLLVKSIRKTADIVGISKTGVGYILGQRKTKMYSASRSGQENSSHNVINQLDPMNPRKQVRNPILMHQLYTIEGKSTTEIASYLGLSVRTVLTGLVQCKITVRTPSEGLLGRPHPWAQGSKHRSWKGGITGWRKLSRERINHYFVYPIMKRDNFKCQECGSVVKLVVHHLRRFASIVGLVRTKIPETDIENFINAIVQEHKLEDGVTWCKKCHDNYHKEQGY